MTRKEINIIIKEVLKNEPKVNLIVITDKTTGKVTRVNVKHEVKTETEIVIYKYE